MDAIKWLTDEGGGREQFKDCPLDTNHSHGQDLPSHKMKYGDSHNMKDSDAHKMKDSDLYKLAEVETADNGPPSPLLSETNPTQFEFTASSVAQRVGMDTENLGHVTQSSAHASNDYMQAKRQTEDNFNASNLDLTAHEDKSQLPEPVSNLQYGIEGLDIGSVCDIEEGSADITANPKTTSLIEQEEPRFLEQEREVIVTHPSSEENRSIHQPSDEGPSVTCLNNVEYENILEHLKNIPKVGVEREFQSVKYVVNYAKKLEELPKRVENNETMFRSHFISQNKEISFSELKNLVQDGKKMQGLIEVRTSNNNGLHLIAYHSHGKKHFRFYNHREKLYQQFQGDDVEWVYGPCTPKDGYCAVFAINWNCIMYCFPSNAKEILEEINKLDLDSVALLNDIFLVHCTYILGTKELITREVVAKDFEIVKNYVCDIVKGDAGKYHLLQRRCFFRFRIPVVDRRNKTVTWKQNPACKQ